MPPPQSDTAYQLSIMYHVTDERLFNAFLDETTLKNIWGVSNISIDARVGGKAEAKLNIEGQNWNFTLTYTEVVPNKRLQWVARFERFPGKEVRTTLDIHSRPNGTELVVRQENFQNARERDENREAWQHALGVLGTLLGA